MLKKSAVMKSGDKYNGFTVTSVEEIPSIRVTALQIKHDRTGAEILHLYCDDPENLFSVGFRTPPRDSTGVAHILEHSVLAGSERYPVKDAFNELAKGTLQTFINAFTYPDKTVYPVSSQVKADFFNLARVYSDLVLRPRLLPETFYQEGRHYELADPGDLASDLIVSGIVFNEMRGAYSSPDTLMYKSLQESLYPDTIYRFDSGGNPQAIPQLTYEQLKSFHRAFYSPSNARFFLYGSIRTEEHLEFLGGVLADFERVAVDSGIGLQPRLSSPRRVSGYYPAAVQDMENKTMVNAGWMMMENTDYESVILLRVLSEALVGNAAGPLRKALIDSGLGQDLTPVTGMEDDLRQIAFAVGLRGCASGNAEKIENTVLDVLKKTAQEGLDPELIEGSLHQIEFRGREILRTQFPYSIVLMQRAYHTWLYGGDPLAGLKFPETIEKLRRQWAGDPGLFQRFVQKWFVDNPHRVLSVLEPSASFIEEMDRALKEQMAGEKAGLSRRDLEEIRDNAVRLKKVQAEPDSPGALATLPRLKRTEIPTQIDRIPASEARLDGVPVYSHEIFANGVAYLDLAFDVSDLDDPGQMILPVIGKLRTGMGAAGLDYLQTAKRKTLKTGGIGYSLAAGLNAEGTGNWQKMVFRLRMLHRDIPEAVKLLGDLLLEGDLSDEGRIRDIILESRNKLQASVIPGGHIFARRTAAAGISVPACREEQWNGRSQLCFQNEIAESYEKKKDWVAGSAGALQKRIFRRGRLFVNITGDDDALKIMGDELAGFISRMPAGSPDMAAPAGFCPGRSPREGIAIPAQVCYVAQAYAAPAYYGEFAPQFMVLCRILSSEYLYKNIRVLGGAYGGMSSYDPLAGHFAFLSYRDPHLLETLRVYEGAMNVISDGRIAGEELEKAVIGTIGALDRPMDPSTKGYVSMVRKFAGLTDEGREKFRLGVLECDREAVLEAGRRVLLPARTSGAREPGIAVYASEERLAKANEHLDQKLTIKKLTCL
ncbi:MAG: insulinase family protein [Syntrophaceae bacterium]